MKRRYAKFALSVGFLLILTFHVTASQSYASPIKRSQLPAPAAQEIYLPLLVVSSAVDGPLNVNPQPDAGRAVRVTVPLAGGQVVATSANNTRFTLTIPPNALAATTTITPTPVAQITGLPNVQLVGAVEIEPLNVLLLQAAKLEIKPAQAVPVPQEYPFAYYGDGQDFHAYPIQPYSKGLIYPVGTFDGGYGIARTNAEAMAAGADVPAVTPANPEARIRSEIADLIHDERMRQLLGQEPDPTLWPKIRDLALEYYNGVIKPTLQPSTVDCEHAKAHIANAVGWLRAVTLLFGDDATEPEGDPAFLAAGDEVMDALIKAAKNCYHEATTPCVHWDVPEQVSEVLGHYRTLVLLGSEEGEIPPQHLPQCTFVDVTLQGGAFHYEFEPNIWGTWSRAVYFRFVDDTVSSVGFYYPFRRKGSSLPGPTATISITARIDGVWQPVTSLQRFFCRDQKAERLQELMMSFAETEGELTLPPQLYADNIGCWRWTGSVRHDSDYKPSSSIAEYYYHKSGQITLERDPNQAYFAHEEDGEVEVHRVGYRLVSPSMVNFDHKLHQVLDGKTVCLQTLTAHISNPSTYVSPNFSGIELPNAGFGLPRAVGSGSGLELLVDLPYTTQGPCPGAGQSLDGFGLPVKGDLSADGRRIQRTETGPEAEGMATFLMVVDLEAQRE